MFPTSLLRVGPSDMRPPRGKGPAKRAPMRREDGRLFRNMFYLRAVSLNDKQYIIGLQTEVPDGAAFEVYHEARAALMGPTPGEKLTHLGL